MCYPLDSWKIAQVWLKLKHSGDQVNAELDPASEHFALGAWNKQQFDQLCQLCVQRFNIDIPCNFVRALSL